MCESVNDLMSAFVHVSNHELTISCLAFYQRQSLAEALYRVPVELDLDSGVREYHFPRYLSLVLAYCMSD